MSNITGVAPVITSTGISAPTFAQIWALFQAKLQSIYGADFYLDPDSQDGQMWSFVAQALADMNSALLANYSSFDPNQAQGVRLSALIALNGLERLVATNSTAMLQILGTADTPIANGAVIDGQGNLWALPSQVTIAQNGSVTVVATCTTEGAIEAGANTITQLQQPVYGVQSITNPAAAIPGAPVETDAAARVRQAASTELPSQTIVAGIAASLANLPGVTRVKAYENNTAVVTGGINANSMAFVVEGGTAAQIFNAIGLQATPGIPLMGTSSSTYTSPNGSTKQVAYYQATEVPINFQFSITPGPGWSTTVEAAINASLQAYLLSINPQASGTVSWTSLFAPAYAPLQQFPGTYTISAMQVSAGSGAFGQADLAIAFNGLPILGTTAYTIL